MKNYYLYYLIDPNDNLVRYVGITYNPKRRLIEHIGSAKRGKKTHKDNWIRKLINSNQKPIMRIIHESHNKSIIFEKEKEEIAKLINLTNSTDGGDYFSFHESVIEKLKLINSSSNNPNYGKKWNDEQRKNHSELMKNRKLNDEWKKKIGLSCPSRISVTINGIKYSSVNEAKQALGISWEKAKKLADNETN